MITIIIITRKAGGEEEEAEEEEDILQNDHLCNAGKLMKLQEKREGCAAHRPFLNPQHDQLQSAICKLQSASCNTSSAAYKCLGRMYLLVQYHIISYSGLILYLICI